MVIITYSFAGFVSIIQVEMKNLFAEYYSIFLAISIALLAGGIQWFGGLQHWNNMVFDQQIKLFPQQPDSSIVVIAIDDWSLENLGQWPWSRKIHAQLINDLTQSGVQAVGLDILFLEPASDPEADFRLAEAIRHNGQVVLPALIELDDNFSKIRVKLPIGQLSAAAASLGHTSIEPDAAGIVRGLHLSTNVNFALQIPAFVTSLFKIGNSSIEKATFPASKQIAFASETKTSLTEYVRIPFSGNGARYSFLSYIDVLKSEKLRKNLKGKYVLIGVNASGLGLRFATPVTHDGKLMSGIEFNAHALDMLLNDTSIHYLQKYYSVLLTVCLILIPISLYSFASPRFTFLIFISFLSLSLSISLYLLLVQHLFFGLVPIISALFLGYLFWGKRYIDLVSGLLFKEKARANVILQAIGEAVVMTDSRGKIEFMNLEAENLSVYPLIKARGKYFNDIFCTNHIGECHDKIEIMDKMLGFQEISSNAQIKCLTNHLGQKYTIQLIVNPIINDDGETSGVIYAIRDMTELFTINQQMAYLATHDSLTELPNRTLLGDRLTQAINLAKRSKNHVAVLFIDLDGFKKINDGLGHSAGDLLLKQIAMRLISSVRKIDTAARWGGDEFVIVLENLEHAEYVIEIAEKLLHLISQPINVFGQDLFVTASIGISLFPKDGQTTDDLLAHADAVMYSVKDSGRNAFRFYSNEFNKCAGERLKMEKELHQALLNDEFELYYQPQINLNTQQIMGAEALLRWKHPQRGIISPAEFISLAEDIGLIIPIGEWVLKSVCQQIKAWRDIGLPSIRIAVNLSPRQFMQPKLLNTIKKLIFDYQIIPNELELEVTESLMMKDLDQVIYILQELKDSGVSIAIDDFGTGFSSLNYLNSLPIDVLKIDKSFISKLFNRDANDACIIEAIIVLGHKMNMQVIAEGIETLEQLQFLKDGLCDIGQGYYFHRPLKADRLVELVREQSNCSTY